VIEIDEERALHWLKNGAQPSDPVRVLLQKTGIWSSFTGEAPPPPFEVTAPADPSSSTDDPSDSAETSAPPGEAEVSTSEAPEEEGP
jgi:small subunit ribosomal protein S16